MKKEQCLPDSQDHTPSPAGPQQMEDRYKVIDISTSRSISQSHPYTNTVFGSCGPRVKIVFVNGSFWRVLGLISCKMFRL